MDIGVVFPQTEIGPDAGGVKAFAQAAEDLGYSHLIAYDHVIGADISNRPGWGGAYTLDDQFHEIFVLYSYLAGLTKTIEFVPAVLILPQRQTVLVAKQAASIDRLSGGRLRLGIGIGWNEVEYIGLNENFSNRGRRSEEQIDVLRQLWTAESVDYSGTYHRIPEAGINPLPIQQPIPIWIGGSAPVVMERIGRLADGWFPSVQPGEDLERDKLLVADAARQAGRDPATIGMDGRINIAQMPEEHWGAAIQSWREAGATHMAVVTMGRTMTPSEHIDLIRRFQEVI